MEAVFYHCFTMGISFMSLLSISVIWDKIMRHKWSSHCKTMINTASMNYFLNSSIKLLTKLYIKWLIMSLYSIATVQNWFTICFFFQCTGSQVEYSIELLFGSDSCDRCRDFSTLKYLYLPCLAGQWILLFLWLRNPDSSLYQS